VLERRRLIAQDPATALEECDAGAAHAAAASKRRDCLTVNINEVCASRTSPRARKQPLDRTFKGVGAWAICSDVALSRSGVRHMSDTLSFCTNRRLCRFVGLRSSLDLVGDEHRRRSRRRGFSPRGMRAGKKSRLPRGDMG
jgi:hypothetical protein